MNRKDNSSNSQQVHLNTESDDFQPDYWYQMNGKQSSPTKDSNVAEFALQR